MNSFYLWSQAHLGQGHYVLGYLIVLVSHNWPIMLALTGCIWQGIWLYGKPTRAHVCIFYGWLVLGLTYEYHKHVVDQLNEAIDFLIPLGPFPLNSLLHFIVNPLFTSILSFSIAIFMGYGLWLWTQRPKPALL